MKFGVNRSTAKAEQATDTAKPSLVQTIHFLERSTPDQANSGEVCMRFVGRDAAGAAVYHLTETNNK